MVHIHIRVTAAIFITARIWKHKYLIIYSSFYPHIHNVVSFSMEKMKILLFVLILMTLEDTK